MKSERNNPYKASGVKRVSKHKLFRADSMVHLLAREKSFR